MLTWSRIVHWNWNGFIYRAKTNNGDLWATTNIQQTPEKVSSSKWLYPTFQFQNVNFQLNSWHAKPNELVLLLQMKTVFFFSLSPALQSHALNGAQWCACALKMCIKLFEHTPNACKAQLWSLISRNRSKLFVTRRLSTELVKDTERKRKKLFSRNVIQTERTFKTFS